MARPSFWTQVAWTLCSRGVPIVCMASMTLLMVIATHGPHPLISTVPASPAFDPTPCPTPPPPTPPPPTTPPTPTPLTPPPPQQTPSLAQLAPVSPAPKPTPPPAAFFKSGRICILGKAVPQLYLLGQQKAG
eukprot:CAMPEP_0168397380 /NCGR_PEP_ID=MMETSP0228-20121227/21034_1 /TAXON_ID=133427 /ORGANISM="Protoceratium reticulatum, Strain CCCM 535 (=CCMP 1889)" /LENGTH=131 /DNA_ID=CAMNT_0008410851 /DNA_START=1 /DNA_END=392 /DNA_ORIENTATION=+